MRGAGMGNTPLVAAGAAALGELRFGRAQLQPHLPALFTNLFGVMERPDYPENEYLMRCVMRALGVAGGGVGTLGQERRQRQTRQAGHRDLHHATTIQVHQAFALTRIQAGKSVVVGMHR